MRPQNGGRVVSRSWHCLTISDKALTVLSMDGFWKVGPRLSSVGIRFEDFRDCRVLFRVCPHLGTLSATSQAQPHLESEAQEPLNLATSLLLQGAGVRAIGSGKGWAQAPGRKPLSPRADHLQRSLGSGFPESRTTCPASSMMPIISTKTSWSAEVSD